MASAISKPWSSRAGAPASVLRMSMSRVPGGIGSRSMAASCDIAYLCYDIVSLCQAVDSRRERRFEAKPEARTTPSQFQRKNRIASLYLTSHHAPVRRKGDQMTAELEYVLGTADAEIRRLGMQHAVWRSDATHAWRVAGFRPGSTIIDVGCGPGFAALDLAEL